MEHVIYLMMLEEFECNPDPLDTVAPGTGQAVEPRL
jgi:hypothetical protein